VARPRLILLGWAFALPACGPTVTAEPAVPQSAASDAPRNATPLVAGAWGSVRSGRHGLEIPLPSRGQWSVNDRQEAWLVAQHSASRSELRLRAWRAPRANAPESCLEQARLWRPDLPEPSTATLIEQRALVAPAGYRGTVWVGVKQVGDAAEGDAVAVGARTGRCFVLWYRTRIRGNAAETVVTENLATVSAGVIDRIREVGIEDTVPRERRP